MTKSKKHLMLMVASLALVSCGTVHTSTATLEAKPQAVPETPVAVATPMSAPQVPLVVKSPVVPDDPEPAIAPDTAKTAKADTGTVSSGKPETVKKTPAIVAASVMKTPDVAEEPSSPESKPVPAPTVKPVPEKTAMVTTAKPAAETPAAKPAAAKPAADKPAAKLPVEKPAASTPKPSTPAEVPPAAEAPPTSITPPATAPDQPATSAPAADAAKVDATDKAKPPSSIFANPSSWLKDPKALLQASIGGFPLWLVVLVAVLAFISLVIGFRGKKSPPPATAEIGAGS